MKRNICLTVGMVLAAVAAKASVVNVHVINAQTGKPMANTKVFSCFGGLLAFGHEFDEEYSGMTDANGLCYFNGTNNNPYVSIVVDDDDRPCFYRTYHRYRLRLAKNSIKSLNDHYSVTMRVEQVMRPIPLYVKNVGRTYSKRDFFADGSDEASYDCLAGDWLPPQGTGVVADIVFTRLPTEDLGIVTNLFREVHQTRERLRVTFPGEGNGIVEVKPLEDSDLLVREAPETGYRHEHMSYSGPYNDGVLQKSWYPYNSRAYCFRIRSKMNERGELTEGYYGKVHSGFMFESVVTEDHTVIPVGELEFRYYLNLTSLDRNLEWDLKHNLNPAARE